MLEHNRNLSSIVGAIQDEGPPTSASKGPVTMIRDVQNAAGSVEAATFVPARTGRQRSAWRSFFYLLFAALVLAATFIFFMGSRIGYLVDLPHAVGPYIAKLYTQTEAVTASLAERAGPAGEVESVVPVIVAEQDGSFSNHQIHERQSLIMKQLEELTASIADIKTSSDQHQVDNQGELNEIQEAFQHKLDKVTAVVAGLQERSGDQEESSKQLPEASNDQNVAQSESGTVAPSAPSAPSAHSGGWVVNVANLGHIEAIEKLKKKLHKHGIRTETQEVTIGGKTRYRVRIPGFSTSVEAREYAHNLDGDLGLKGPWVSKR
ncbi:MAG: SPOR domain-containing protein [Gammaproteobacteria bacterium]|nr:SPOR domain-containing protein [Gammaproteobacteria bacterium]